MLGQQVDSNKNDRPQPKWHFSKLCALDTHTQNGGNKCFKSLIIDKA